MQTVLIEIGGLRPGANVVTADPCLEPSTEPSTVEVS